MNDPTRVCASELFSALSNPARLRITELIIERPMTVGEVAEAAGVSLSGASQHLSQLSRAGVVVAEANGNRRTYRVRGPRIARILELIEEFCSVHRLIEEPPSGAEV